MKQIHVLLKGFELSRKNSYKANDQFEKTELRHYRYDCDLFEESEGVNSLIIKEKKSKKNVAYFPAEYTTILIEDKQEEQG